MSEIKKKSRPWITRLITLGALVTRPMILGVRALVIDRNNRVLLVRHTYVDGFWFPGGGVERGETIAEALIRELKEEANVVLGEKAPVLQGVYLNSDACSYDHEALFVVRDFCQVRPFVPTLEIVEAKFFPLDALPADTIPSVTNRIGEVLRGDCPSPYW
jgi:8-oxo-dGTP pyrophosphatase MutT (NUDIX family)